VSWRCAWRAARLLPEGGRAAAADVLGLLSPATGGLDLGSFARCRCASRATRLAPRLWRGPRRCGTSRWVGGGPAGVGAGAGGCSSSQPASRLHRCQLHAQAAGPGWDEQACSTDRGARATSDCASLKTSPRWGGLCQPGLARPTSAAPLTLLCPPIPPQLSFPVFTSEDEATPASLQHSDDALTISVFDEVGRCKGGPPGGL
jgi:hypothetical protein